MPQPIDRRALLSAILVAAITSPGTTASRPARPTKILLVCQFGSVKSPIARELLKRRAAQLGVKVEAKARGITPERHLPEETRRTLAAEGIDPTAEPLQQLEAADIEQADLVIFFDKLPAGYAPKQYRDWSDLPSIVNDYRDARASLDRRIDRLLHELAGKH
jgi:protein-tyrosine-phosphatase